MLGIMGAGKGTQAKRLSRYLDVPHISTGDIFRDAVSEGTELGKRAQKIMADGELVPDEIVVEIVKERLAKDDAADGYILDGFPRTIQQAIPFDEFETIDEVIYITIPEDEAIKRLKGRRYCESCKKDYSVYLDGDIDEKCAECGGTLKQREDDREETVRVRIENYFKQTRPLIEYYENKGILKEIDGNREIETVFEDIKKAV